MNKKKNVIALVPVIGALLLLMSMSKGSVEKIRSTTVALLAPLWHKLLPLKALPSEAEATARLQLETQLLKNENQRLQRLNSELYSNLLAFQRVLGQSSNDIRQSPYYAEWKELSHLHLATVPADVIYRASSTWNSSLWINVGKTNNTSLGHTVIAENSPVIQGNNLIGLIDFVGEKQSRVRLITDSAVVPAVRVLRQEGGNRHLNKSLDLVQQALFHQEAFKGCSNEEKGDAIKLCKTLQHKLAIKASQPLYLAKGELHGSGTPLWKGQSQILQGIGFNCDYGDEKGPARDLRFGTPQGSKGPPIALLKEGDLLVTSGLDGVFPSGLAVAEIRSVHPLQEGDYYYTLEAQPTAVDLDELSLLFVIAPLFYDPEEQPWCRIN